MNDDDRCKESGYWTDLTQIFILSIVLPVKGPINVLRRKAVPVP
jgi:hypothetical protein